MKIGLFFGSFNPIHNGHLIIAEHIINFFTEKVWFIVSPQNPLKKNSDLLHIENRLQLVNSAISGNNNLSISDIELNLPIPSYTIDTLQYLKNEFPDFEFFLIMGSDNFLNISNWKSADLLLSTYSIIIYERPGFLIDPQKFSPNILSAKAPFINISSTEIRELIRTKKSVQYLLPESVELLIKTHNYYR